MGRRKDGNVIDLEETKRSIREASHDLSSIVSSVDDVKLEEMNGKHAFIQSVSGKPVVLHYVYNSVFNRKIIEFISPEAVCMIYSNQSIQVNNSVAELGKWWIKNAHRREYETVIFDPSKPREYNNCLNLWEGFSTEPKLGKWRHTLKHIYSILCNSDPKKFVYTIKWLAWCIQNPGDRAEVAIIFKGKKGAGKGFIFSQFVKLFGQHGMHISNREHLTGKFNGHLKLCVFLFADEAYYPGDKEVEGTLKQLITEPMISIEAKYHNTAISKNTLHIAMATNEQWVISASQDERRYFINEVDNRLAKNVASDKARDTYFTRLWGEMDAGGREAMLYDLQRLDLAGWHPRQYVPETHELVKQRAMSLPRDLQAILVLLTDGMFPGGHSMHGYRVSAQTLFAYLNEVSPEAKKVSMYRKTEILKRIGAKKVRGADKNYWEFPALDIAKENWNKEFGVYDFDGIDKWELIKVDY